MTQRPFRFGVQAFEAKTADEWFATARRVEELYGSSKPIAAGPLVGGDRGGSRQHGLAS